MKSTIQCGVGSSKNKWTRRVDHMIWCIYLENCTKMTTQRGVCGQRKAKYCPCKLWMTPSLTYLWVVLYTYKTTCLTISNYLLTLYPNLSLYNSTPFIQNIQFMQCFVQFLDWFWKPLCYENNVVLSKSGKTNRKEKVSNINQTSW